MTAVDTALDTPFVRSRTTWLGYAFMGFFTFALSLLGPMMPFIAASVGLNFAQIGYHFTLLAVGALLTALVGDRLARRFGSVRMGWGGVLLVALSLPGIVFGADMTVTLFFAFFYGLGIGAVALVAIATIANANPNPRHAARAYAEGNIGGSISLIAGPVFVGAVATSPLGWQAVGFSLLLGFGLLVFLFRGAALPSPFQDSRPQSPPVTDSAPLPLRFWVFGILIFLGVALEWLISAWGPSFLTTVVGYVPGTAAALVSIFAVAMLLGRIIGRRLLDYMSESRLLVLSLVWVLLAFPLYWLSALPLLNLAGLFLIGLGIGNLAPLSMSGAMAAAGAATNRGSARLGLFPPLANLTMVPLVGVLADGMGIQRAYGVVIVVAVVAIIVAASARRITGGTR